MCDSMGAEGVPVVRVVNYGKSHAQGGPTIRMGLGRRTHQGSVGVELG